MEIQTMTFGLRGMTDRQAYTYVESLRLGMSEFDGLEQHARSHRSGTGDWVVSCTWKDNRAVRGFRHSALYARFALSPNVVDLHDRQESVCGGKWEEALEAA